MSYSQYNTTFIEKFAETFPKVSVEKKIIDFSGKIHCFFLKFATHEELENQWNSVSNFIAVNYQTGLDTDFEIWNLYLFYQASFEIDRGLKYKIENDTISSRKIFVEEADKNPEDIVIEHITNTDLQVKIILPDRIVFKKNPIIASVLDNSNAISRKKNKLHFNEVFDSILKGLRDEI